MNALLIAGTDLGVGKTVLLNALLAYWQHYYANRPIATLEAVHAEEATIPSAINLEQTWQRFEALMQQQEFVLLEYSGGLGTPLTLETTVADLAWDWRIPTVLVVPIGPGAIAQAVANVALAQQSRLFLKGIVLNENHPCHKQEREEWAPIDLLQSLTQKPVLGYIPYLGDPSNSNKLVQVAANLELERLLPLSY